MRSQTFGCIFSILLLACGSTPPHNDTRGLLDGGLDDAPDVTVEPDAGLDGGPDAGDPPEPCAPGTFRCDFEHGRGRRMFDLPRHCESGEWTVVNASCGGCDEDPVIVVEP